MFMSSIDLVILGMLLEKPQSAYEIQKDIEYHHFSRWTKISIPSIYKKVHQLKEKGYLKSQVKKGSKFTKKAVYSITDEGKSCFFQLMKDCVDQPVSFVFDFNVVITNLNKIEKDKALELIDELRNRITSSSQENRQYADLYRDIPLVGKTVFKQQQLLYNSLLQWLDDFETQFKLGG